MIAFPRVGVEIRKRKDLIPTCKAYMHQKTGGKRKGNALSADIEHDSSIIRARVRGAHTNKKGEGKKWEESLLALRSSAARGRVNESSRKGLMLQRRGTSRVVRRCH